MSGVLETLASRVLVVEYLADAWMQALMDFPPALISTAEPPGWNEPLRAGAGSCVKHQWPTLPRLNAAFHDRNAAELSWYAQAVQRTGFLLQDLSCWVLPDRHACGHEYRRRRTHVDEAVWRQRCTKGAGRSDRTGIVLAQFRGNQKTPGCSLLEVMESQEKPAYAMIGGN
jgi:hypothetical protein